MQRVLPPDSASAPKLSQSTEKPCSRNTSSSASPMPTDAIASAVMPSRSAVLRASTPIALTSEQIATSTAPATTIALAVG